MKYSLLSLHGELSLFSSYCTNISFYLVLKAKRIPAHNHPVIERLLTYRNVSTNKCTFFSQVAIQKIISFQNLISSLSLSQLINELGAVDARLAPQLRQLLSGEQQDRTLKKPASSTHIEVITNISNLMYVSYSIGSIFAKSDMSLF